MVYAAGLFTEIANCGCRVLPLIVLIGVAIVTKCLSPCSYTEPRKTKVANTALAVQIAATEVY